MQTSTSPPSWILSKLIFHAKITCRNAKFGEAELINISGRFSVGLTLVFTLNRTLTSTCKTLTVKFDTDAEYLCQISWKIDFYFSRNHKQTNERNNKPTNTPDHWSQYTLVEVITLMKFNNQQSIRLWQYGQLFINGGQLPWNVPDSAKSERKWIPFPFIEFVLSYYYYRIERINQKWSMIRLLSTLNKWNCLLYDSCIFFCKTQTVVNLEHWSYLLTHWAVVSNSVPEWFAVLPICSSRLHQYEFFDAPVPCVIIFSQSIAQRYVQVQINPIHNAHFAKQLRRRSIRSVWENGRIMCS